MSGEPFLDTNVLIYAFAAEDSKSPKAETLLAAGGVISVQVLNEFANVCAKKLGLGWTEIEERLGIVRALARAVRPLTLETHAAALAIARGEKIGLYDALIVASALDAKCETLFTEDLQDGRAFGRLRVVNPFGAARG